MRRPSGVQAGETKRLLPVVKRRGADGSNALQLTNLEGPRAGHPNWSPDGKQIVFHSNRGGDYHLFLVPSNGGPARRLTSAPEPMQAPRWSPDAKWVYFQCRQGGQDRLCRIPPAGGPVESIGPATDAPVYEPYPTTDRLCFAQGAGRVRKLCSVPLASPGTQVCLDLPMLFSVFAVSVRGRYIVVQPSRNASEIHFDGGDTTVCKMPYPVGPLALSPDGRHLLFSYLHMWTMDLFRLQLE